jgi:hypothetical protein
MATMDNLSKIIVLIGIDDLSKLFDQLSGITELKAQQEKIEQMI